jgi:hypothetical protein
MFATGPIATGCWRDVCFPLDSNQTADIAACLKGATSGLMHCNNIAYWKKAVFYRLTEGCPLKMPVCLHSLSHVSHMMPEWYVVHIAYRSEQVFLAAAGGVADTKATTAIAVPMTTIRMSALHLLERHDYRVFIFKMQTR